MIRVTEVLNYFKEPWYVDWVCRVGKREANRVSKAAMKIGTRVDELIKSNGTPSSKDKPEVQCAMNAYAKWLHVYKPTLIVNGTRHDTTIEGQEVSGEPDLFVDGVLVDIKCSSKISPLYWVQVNMYSYLTNHLGRVGILRLDKTTASYEYVVKDYDKSLVDVWLGLMRAMVYLKGDGDGTVDV